MVTASEEQWRCAVAVASQAVRWASAAVARQPVRASEPVLPEEASAPQSSAAVAAESDSETAVVS